jgi:hypothetical protein
MRAKAQDEALRRRGWGRVGLFLIVIIHVGAVIHDSVLILGLIKVHGVLFGC